MCNLQFYIIPKFSSHCFIVLCSFFLLFFACTTTESDQNVDQLARRMKGWQTAKDSGSFYARVYTYAKQKLVHKCAGAFITYDLVITSLQCVLVKGVYKVDYKTIVQRSDFSDPMHVRGDVQRDQTVNNFIVDVSHIHENPQYKAYRSGEEKSPKELMYDVALLQIEKPFLDGTKTWRSVAFKPLLHCESKSIPTDWKLKMIGLKLNHKFTISTYFDDKKMTFDFESGFLQEAPIRENDLVYLRRGENRMMVVVDEQITRMDDEHTEIGSPAVLYSTDNSPKCLYGVISSLNAVKPNKKSPLEGSNDAVILEGTFLYDKWLKEEYEKSQERWYEREQERLDNMWMRP